MSYSRLKAPLKPGLANPHIVYRGERGNACAHCYERLTLLTVLRAWEPSETIKKPSEESGRGNAEYLFSVYF